MNLTLLTKEVMGNGCTREVGGYTEVISYVEVVEEYNVLRKGVGLIDLSACGKLKLTGEAHVEFINRTVSKDIEYLDVEKTALTLLLDYEGKVIDLITVFKLEDSILLQTSTGKRQQVLDWFNELKTDGVEVEDLSDTMAIVAFEGPYAWKLGQTLINFEISSLPFQSFTEIEYAGEPAIFARTGVTGEYGYQVLVPMSAAPELWRALLATPKEDYVVQQVGTEAISIAMMEVRQPTIEIQTGDLSVYEACLEWLISFHKESFIGLESINAQHKRGIARRIIGFAFDSGNSLAPGDLVVVDNVTVGQILQAKYSPGIQRNLGLAIVNQTFAVSGIEMEGLNGQLNKRVPIETLSSPYVIPKSWSIKII